MSVRRTLAEVVIYEGDDCSMSNPRTRIFAFYVQDGRLCASDEDWEAMASSDAARLVGEGLLSAPIVFVMSGAGARRALTDLHAPAPTRALEERPPQRQSRKGFVYLLHSNGVYKIGHAASVEKRVAQISPVMPYPVEVLFSIPAEDRFSLEADLHKAFSDKRLNGEWFALTEDDLEAIKNWGVE